MLTVIVAATLTCVGALTIGQAACWLCGARTWTFLAAPVGLALMMLVSVTAIHAPGHASTIAVVLLVLVAASLVLLTREPALRPRPVDLLSAAPVFLMVLLPFLANARVGTLGVAFDNDMQAHLLWAEAIRSPSVAKIAPLDAAYPLGPHALSAVLAQATGMRIDYAFTGETMALPILLAWTALGALGRVGWPGRAFVASMTAATFMVASYYGQGSFKEIMQALFVLGFALGVQELIPGRPRQPLRWVPLGLIVGGSLSVYTVAGLSWLVAILGLWLMMLGARRVLRGASLGALIGELRQAVLPAAIALGVLLVLIVPQIPRLAKYYEGLSGAGIPTSNLGNLAGPVSFWEVFGMWDGADYRLPAINAFNVGMFAAFGLLLALVGVVWWLRNDGLAIPLATGVALVIWIYSDDRQSPYVAAKALMILAPLVALMMTRWLVELRPGESWLSSAGTLRVGVAALLGWAVLGTSVEALRYAAVGPTAHVDDLRRLEPVLGRSPTLFLGWDDFVRWELAGTPVAQPYFGFPEFALRPQKSWMPGQPFDFDDIPPATLDEYRYVVGPRDPAGSQPPSNMRLIRTTRYYEVWERDGPTPDRQILAEGPEPSAKLDCASPKGRALVAHAHGEAALRAPNIVVAVPPLAPGMTTTVHVGLKPGSWWLSAPYVGPYPIEVTAPGLRTTLPANLDRVGNRWPVGQITVARTMPIAVTLHVPHPSLALDVPTYVNALVATSKERDHVVPLRQACGQYVDWYTTSERLGF